MTILWLILKIILWLFIGLISVCCFLVIGILCLPIIYEIEGEKQEILRGKVDLNLFYILTIKYDFNKSEEIEFKLLGFKLNTSKHPKGYPKKQKKNTIKEKTNPSPKEPKKEQVNSTKKEGIKRETVQVHKHSTTKKQSIKKQNAKTQSKPKDQSSTKSTFKQIYNQLKEIWQLQERTKFVKACKKLLLRWWRALKPQYVYFEILFGLEDPSETGIWLAKLMTFYPFYAPYGQVRGNFEEEILQGSIYLKGKTSLIKYIYPLLVFIAHKEVRIMIKKLINIGKDDNDGIKT